MSGEKSYWSKRYTDPSYFSIAKPSNLYRTFNKINMTEFHVQTKPKDFFEISLLSRFSFFFFENWQKVLHSGLQTEKDWMQDAMEATVDQDRFLRFWRFTIDCVEFQLRRDFKLILWSRSLIGWRSWTRHLIGWERHLDSISCNPRVRESMNREGFCLELDVEAVVNREIARRLSLDSVVSQLGFQISFLKFLWFSYVCYHYF